jgi:hypothetical protein
MKNPNKGSNLKGECKNEVKVFDPLLYFDLKQGKQQSLYRP